MNDPPSAQLERDTHTLTHTDRTFRRLLFSSCSSFGLKQQQLSKQNTVQQRTETLFADSVLDTIPYRYTECSCPLEGTVLSFIISSKWKEDEDEDKPCNSFIDLLSIREILKHCSGSKQLIDLKGFQLLLMLSLKQACKM